MAHPTEDRNFRLPTSLRPRRYQAHVKLDMAAKAFSGEQTIALTADASTREVVLHATELTLSNVRLVQGARTVSVTGVRNVPVSETVVLELGEALEAGEAELSLQWTGKFCEGLRGLYASGEVASTQFEAADARRLFPSFDEPAFKAHWALSVDVPKGVTALGNGKVIKDEEKNGVRTVTFAETELLSSYLIALVVGPLVGTPEQKVGEVPVRTWALPQKQHLMAFGQEAAVNALPRLQDYFGLPYAFGKVDQAGIPDFEAGAMENAGLITYREVALLLDPATAPLSVQKRVAEVVTHELAHQWFGNWVTMVWWDDLWLNEAFATWMAYKIVDGWKPKWRVWLDFDFGKAVALHLDALKSTHPIRGVVRNAAEAGESFDAITYEKGGAVLRMIESFLGEHDFREGIRLYMKRHARANAVADDLWRALAEASSQPVTELANAWIRQSGHPILSVSREGRKVKVSQQRFYSEGGVSSDERWPVPMVLKYRDAKGVQETRYLLREGSATVELPGEGAVQWVCANARSGGFYRVAYDAAAAGALAQDLGSLEPSERISLLADRWAEVRAGRAPIGAYLDLAEQFGHEEDDAVLDELVGRLSFIEHRLVEGDARLKMHAFVEKLLGHQLTKLGWDPATGETDDVRLRRASVIRALGLVGRSPTVLAEARKRVQDLLGGKAGVLEPNLLDSSISLVARHGDAALFDALLKRFPEEPDPATKRRYLLALAAFEDPALAARAQKLVLEGGVPMQDTAFYLGSLLGNRVGRASFWKTLREQWEVVLQRTGRAPMLLRRVVEGLGQLVDRDQLLEAKAFLTANPLAEVQQAVAQTLERLEQDVALRERTQAEVASWLSKR